MKRFLKIQIFVREIKKRGGVEFWEIGGIGGCGWGFGGEKKYFFF
jgi:hypothetical protein